MFYNQIDIRNKNNLMHSNTSPQSPPSPSPTLSLDHKYAQMINHCIYFQHGEEDTNSCSGSNPEDLELEIDRNRPDFYNDISPDSIALLEDTYEDIIPLWQQGLSAQDCAYEESEHFYAETSKPIYYFLS
jgi:hypothetical protein